ncbi:hypothetical protein L7F22_012237 [Adiantum nelumboides]|nr:hypothetical protein [Adiantum nelumboides]
MTLENVAVQDSSVADAEHARALLGHVDRKLVKQTVMTSVYGVTFVGARAQILIGSKKRGRIKTIASCFLCHLMQQR